MAAVTPKSKVRYGISQLTFWPLETDGTGSENPTYGTKIEVPGTVTVEVEYESNELKFYADNGPYYNTFSQSGNSGSLENAMFPNELKALAYGWRVDANGGLVEVKDGKPKHFAMAYQIEGDADALRVVHYDVTLGLPQESHRTTEDGIEIDTETVDYSGKEQLVGAEKVSRYSLPETATGYDTWFGTTPVFPAAAA